MFGSSKIIEALATIKADTKNHNGELKELKETFNKHIDKEEKQQDENSERMDKIHGNLEKFKCPHDEKIMNLERRIHDNGKRDQRRRESDLETREQDIKDRAKKDEKIAEQISSLKSARKYNYASFSGVYIVMGVILKKIFS